MAANNQPVNTSLHNQAAIASATPKPKSGKMQLGVIGGGQLAWMMGAAASKLGIDLLIQTPNSHDPAVAIASHTILAPINDATATAQLAQKCDLITFENEFVNLEALSHLAQGVCFRPGLNVLAPLLDKYHQRCYLEKLGIPQPKFVVETELQTTDLSFPVVLKARRHGYDGQGTFVIKDLQTLQQKLARQQQAAFLVEEFIPFERELAIIAARSADGKVVTYPAVETQQQQQVCRRVIAPADISDHVTSQVEAIAHTLLNSLEAVGVFGIELFLTSAQTVLVNEIAPRTHNSGHYTLDACATSQFEQHIRAVCDLPLGCARLNCAGAVMVNLLGYEDAEHDYLDKRQQLSAIPQAHVYWYGKTSRPGRKLGHVTVLLDRLHDSQSQIAQLESIWYGDKSGV